MNELAVGSRHTTHIFHANTKTVLLSVFIKNIAEYKVQFHCPLYPIFQHYKRFCFY